MAEKDRADLEAYFETGDTPTEAEFAELIESVPNFQDDAILFDFEFDIIAYSGGGQANAFVLTARNSTILTVAAPGDSVKFGTTTRALAVMVANISANSCDVFPPSGHQINSLGADTAYPLIGSRSAEFFYMGDSRWMTNGVI